MLVFQAEVVMRKCAIKPASKRYQWNKMRESWTKIQTPYTYMDTDIRLGIIEWLNENAGLPDKDWVSGVDYKDILRRPPLYFMFRDPKVATIFAIRWL